MCHLLRPRTLSTAPSTPATRAVRRRRPGRGVRPGGHRGRHGGPHRHGLARDLGQPGLPARAACVAVGHLGDRRERFLPGARSVLASEFVAVVLAIGWTVPYMVDPDRSATMLLQVLDKFCPISMLGTLVVGIMVARARRWPAPLRYLPVAASLLLFVDVSFVWTPEAVRSTMSGVYLATSYGLLGLAPRAFTSVGLVRRVTHGSACPAWKTRDC